MNDVVALGELLIDFTPCGISNVGNVLFETNPGGAPANVAVAISKLGKKSAFIGMVGQDNFGVFLKNTLKNEGVDTTSLKLCENSNTTLAFVHLSENGDRSFSFYRDNGADTMLSKKDIDFELIRGSRIFHFGSISLSHEPSRTATISAVEFAKDCGLIISYDPNLRPALWKSVEDMKKKVEMGLKFADILKISEEELEFITGTSDLEKGSLILFERGISVVLITLGAQGVFCRFMGGICRVKGYGIDAIDTNGAGDAFLSGFLFEICEMTLNELQESSKEKLEEILNFSNAIGGLVATKKGAIPAMPTIEEVKFFRDKYYKKSN
jgi:fructokinase